MSVVAGPYTVKLDDKNDVHVIPLGIALDKIVEFDEIKVSLHMKSTDSYGRVVLCVTEGAQHEICEKATGKVTAIDESLMHEIRDCQIGPIVKTGDLSQVVWQKLDACPVIDASIAVIREIGGEQRDDSVTIVLIRHGKSAKVAQQKAIEADGTPAKKARRKW